MGILAPPIHIKDRSGTNDCIRYIQDPEKIIHTDDTGNVIRYMQSHCIEDIQSVGYNGCSGVRSIAVEQFRLDEEKYRMLHPKRKIQHTVLPVLDYLESNHKRRLPKRFKPVIPTDGKFEMSFEHAQRVWRDETKPESERQTAREVLTAYTLKIEKSETLAEHLILSLHPSDNPTPEQMRAVVDEFMQHAFFKGFKCISNIHWNEEHKHAHLLINNFNDTGTHKLSLSGTKLRELQRYFDHICYNHGFSIVDSREARLDPEHANWIDLVKAEGRIQVFPPREASDKIRGRTWKGQHNYNIDTQIQSYVDAGIDPEIISIEQDLLQNDLFAGDEFWIHMTERSMTPYERETQKKKEEEEQRLEEKRRKRRTEDARQWREVYVVRTRVYDRDCHRYRHRSLICQIFQLAWTILFYEGNFLEDNYPSRYQKYSCEDDNIFAKRNTKLQSMIDSMYTCRDLNINTPNEMDQRLDQIGSKIGEVKRNISYNESMLSSMEEDYQSLIVFTDPHRSKEERDQAYAALASHRYNTNAKLVNLRDSYRRTTECISSDKTHLSDLNNDYRRLKHAIESIKMVQYDCERIHYAAREASVMKPEMGAQIRIAERKKSEQTAFPAEHSQSRIHTINRTVVPIFYMI